MLQQINMVKCASKIKRFEKGSIIMQAGNNSPAQMYILLKGSVIAYVDLKKPTEKLIATYKAGDFFGEYSLFLGQPSPATFIAAEDVISLPLSRQTVEGFFAEQPEATLALVEELCRRISSPAPQAAAAPQKAAAPAKAAKPAKAQAEPKPASVSKTQNTSKTAVQDEPQITTPGVLFPPEHKTHKLPMLSADSEYLFMKSYTCPICGKNFKYLAVKTSKLVPERTDSDLRVHYSGVEPLHYDIVTCPSCWYSAMIDMFKDGAGNKEQLQALMLEYKDNIDLKLDENRDSQSVFAGYYLALLCAAKCFRNSDAAIGKLWLKLSRLYDDCQDEKMSLYAAEQALRGYMNAYERSNTTGKQNQQLFYIIGELSIRLNDLRTARRFLFQAKVDKGGSPIITRHAEDRIEYLREQSQKEAEAEKKK